jgi:hypothetical protein
MADRLAVRRFAHVIDLTHALSEDTPYIPVPGITFPFDKRTIATIEQTASRRIGGRCVVTGAYDASFGFSTKRLTLYDQGLLTRANAGACGNRVCTHGREEDVSSAGWSLSRPARRSSIW